MFLASIVIPVVLAGAAAIAAAVLSQNKTKPALVPVKKTTNKKQTNPLV
jgi:hypothetical protein